MTSHPSGLVVRTADLRRSKPPRWAWHQRVPLGYLSLIVGNEGIGKGALAAWKLARLTRGELPGDLRGEPVTVAILGDEDGFDDVWTPRLHAAGADLTRVRLLERPDGGLVQLNEGTDEIEEAIDLHVLRVIYVDQLLDNLGTNTDDYRAKEVRQALQPMRALARRAQIAFEGSLHPNKRADSFRQLVAGAGFNALSRSSLLLARHPEDESRRVLVRGKGNLSVAPRALEFDITSKTFDANGHTFDLPCAVRFAESDLTVDDLLEAAGKPAAHSKVGEAEDIIEALLPRDGEWHAAKPIFDAGEVDEIDKRTMQRAKLRLDVEHRRSPAFQAPVEWRWPLATTDTPRVTAVASVASVASAATDRLSTDDTHDTHDTPHACRESVVSAESVDDEWLRLAAKFGPDLFADSPNPRSERPDHARRPA